MPGPLPFRGRHKMGRNEIASLLTPHDLTCSSLGLSSLPKKHFYCPFLCVECLAIFFFFGLACGTFLGSDQIYPTAVTWATVVTIPKLNLLNRQGTPCWASLSPLRFCSDIASTMKPSTMKSQAMDHMHFYSKHRACFKNTCQWLAVWPLANINFWTYVSPSIRWE